VDERTDKVATTLSSEYFQILEAVLKSRYYTSNPNEACLFLPSLDLLNQNVFDKHLAGAALASLDFWDRGANHIIFNMLPGGAPSYNTVLDVNTDNDWSDFRFPAATTSRIPVLPPSGSLKTCGNWSSST